MIAAVCACCPWYALCDKSSNHRIPNLTCCNTNVIGHIRYVGSNNCNVSRKDANVIGRIRYAGCYIAIAGDRISNRSQFIVQSSPSAPRLPGQE